MKRPLSWQLAEARRRGRMARQSDRRAAHQRLGDRCSCALDCRQHAGRVCGCDDKSILEIDHRQPVLDRHRERSSAATQAEVLRLSREEANRRFQLLCPNCHTHKTNGERGGYRAGRVDIDVLPLPLFDVKQAG